MDDPVRASVQNNAAWCDTVCRSHGLTTLYDARFWATAARPPTFYPDAVTLDPTVVPAEILARIDDSRGASIKDSFAVLDLDRFGYNVLFDAQWYLLESDRRPPPAEGAWSVVRTPEALASWAAAHGLGDVLRATLLDDPEVRILVRHLPGGGLAGAIASRAAGVVGVSKVFSPGTAEGAWEGLVDAIGAAFPGETLVGYGTGEHLRAALSEGFRTIGPLRVWVRR
jgi:hypothetical protein